MNFQQKFGQRLHALLEEKEISQGYFADTMHCSRQSINFYILGKRSPDIAVAAEMAQYLGVSCDYLVGLSDFRNDREANLTVNQVGLTEDTMKFFAGLKIMAFGMAHYTEEPLSYGMLHAQATLDLLNKLISHHQFGILLQYIKKYRDLCHGEDEMAILQNFMIELESPVTGKSYGSKEENLKLMQEFCLHVILNYFDDIIRDISK